MGRIAHIELHCLRIPLVVPYTLSITRIDAFDTLLVEMHDDAGRLGLGEATVLTGYTDETMAQCWSLANTLAAAICGLEFARAMAHLEQHLRRAPFTTTALATAIEMVNTPALLSSSQRREVSLVALVSKHDKTALQREIGVLLEQGYRTFKVKIGFNVDEDLAHVRDVQRVLAGRGAIRIDANQGYTQAQALEFVRRLDPMDIELLEQTCPAGDWDAARAVAAAATVPVMLDESVYGLEDIDRAARLAAADLIKFKLMKAGGLEKLSAAIRRIRALGMRPLLGNGVAADIGCWMEACAAHAEALDNAGEMNGFLKTVDSLVTEPLPVAEGKIIIPEHYWPQLDHQVLARYREQYSERSI